MLLPDGVTTISFPAVTDNVPVKPLSVTTPPVPLPVLVTVTPFPLEFLVTENTSPAKLMLRRFFTVFSTST